MKKKLLSIALVLCLALTLLPATASARQWTSENTISEGWYYLRAMNNYLNFTASGEAELRKLSENTAFYVESLGGCQYTLKLENGKYLGLTQDAARKDGTRVKAVAEPYIWWIYWEATNFNKTNSDLFSLRVPEAQQLVMNASGQKRDDGTPVIVWTHKDMNAPEHAEFRFIPADDLPDSTGESWTVYSVGQKATDSYKEGFKDKNGNIVIEAKFNWAEKFSQGLAKVRIGAKAGFINMKGVLVTELKYDYPYCHSAFSNGLLKVGAVVGGKAKYGYINTAGKEVIPLQFDGAYAFSEGMAAVLKYQGTKYGVDYHKMGYINTAGKLVIPYQYGGENLYTSSTFNYSDGMAIFANYQGTKTLHADGSEDYTPLGIMNKNAKAIIPADPSGFYPNDSFGLRWSDGVIINNYYTEVNKDGVPTKGGGHTWSFVELYDYSGKLIKKLDGYRLARPLGGGYTLAQHQLNEGQKVQYLDTEAYECYWTVFDRYGNIVFDHQAKNDYYVLGFRADEFGYGYANGYVFFAGVSCKVGDVAASAPATQANPFTDVPSGTYYYDAVIWAKDTGVTGGTTATTFSPNAPCTRGQVVTFLWRAQGQPEPKSTNNPFTDVSADKYYYKAVLWAVEQGITGGTTATTFSPNATCTNAHVVTFLYRANGSPASNGADSPYYAKAVDWAANKGLLENMGAFSAGTPSPRSAIVTYLYRNAGSPTVKAG